MTRFKALSSASCLIAALSLTATPAIAAELPVAAPHNASSSATGWDTAAWDADSENAERRRHRRHRNRGVDAGDVIAGVLILGGIAAIASAASEPRRERNYPVENQRYRDRRSDVRTGGGEGIDNAVNMCLSQIERNVRVESVDSVNRSGDGWNVSGTLYNGDGFDCQIGNDGRISGISYGGQTAQADYGQVEDRQYSDDRYSAAWDREEAQPARAYVQPDQQQQPAYPGGPLPGDEDYDEGMGG